MNGQDELNFARDWENETHAPHNLQYRDHVSLLRDHEKGFNASSSFKVRNNVSRRRVPFSRGTVFLITFFFPLSACLFSVEPSPRYYTARGLRER